MQNFSYNYEFDYYQYKKRTSKKTGLAFCILIIFIIFLTGVAVYFKPIKTSNYEFYFVKTNSCSTYTQANTFSQEIQNSGGAGYIYFDDKYHILVNFYQNKKDANKVLENLKDTYLNAELYTISAKKFKNFSKFTKKQNKSIENLSNFTISLINDLSKISIEYDKNEITFNQISIKLNLFLNDFQDIYNEFLNQFKTNSKQNVSREYAYNIKTNLESLSNFNEDNFKQKSKYFLVDTIINYCSFLDSF